MVIYEKWIETATVAMTNVTVMMEELKEESSSEEKKFYIDRIRQELELAAKCFHKARLEIVCSNDWD